jgi:hypothetical protein
MTHGLKPDTDENRKVIAMWIALGHKVRHRFDTGNSLPVGGGWQNVLLKNTFHRSWLDVEFYIEPDGA